jgi:DNA-binding transcriptional LysR family regulator
VSFRRGQLQYFVAVAEEGQITRAARKLQIAQPALSQAIAQLEAELGLTLLERHARGVTLTPAGVEFHAKARSLARAETGTINFGFLGAAPGLASPAPLEAFAETHAAIDIHYRELPFPSTPLTSWLSEVDVGVCHRPPPDPNVWTQLLRREPRVVLAPRRHHLADRDQLRVADVIDETFIGFHPSIEPSWAGFWSLDDHRDGEPGRMTVDRASNPQEVLAALAIRKAITTVPTSVAGVIANVLTGMVAIPLPDAEPTELMLVGHNGRPNPLVASLLRFAREFSD